MRVALKRREREAEIPTVRWLTPEVLEVLFEDPDRLKPEVARVPDTR